MPIADERDLEIEALRERLSRLSEASLRINESLDLDRVLQGVLDSARALTGALYGVILLFDEYEQIQDSPDFRIYIRPGCTAVEDARWEENLRANRWILPCGES